MTPDADLWRLIAMIATATFMSRMAGAMVMNWVPMSPPVARFLDGVSVSVIAALVGSALAGGDMRMAAAVAASAGVSLGRNRPVLSMAAGMATAAAWSAAVRTEALPW